MPFNGAGSYSPPATDFPAVANTLIESAKFNNVINDIATALSSCIAKDGQTTITANLPMNNFRHTGVGNAAVRTDYAAYGQLQDGVVNWVAAGGAADAITATYGPALTALVDGQLACFRASAANATTTPTFSPNGLTARTITRKGGTALLIGDIPGALAEVILRYNLANTRWELLNPAGLQSGAPVNNPDNLTQTLTDAANIAWDMSAGQIASVTLGGNRTMNAPSNLKKGTYILHVLQDGTGTRLLTWNAVFKWQSALAPTLSTGINKRDVFCFICDGTNLYGSFLIDVR